jgi:hypothetical protein
MRRADGGYLALLREDVGYRVKVSVDPDAQHWLD